MSSMYSGSSHLRIDDDQDDDTDGERNKANKAKLSVGELRQSPERLAPGARRQKRKQPLEDEHQSARGQERFRHRLSLSPDGSLLGARTRHALVAARLLQIPEELGIRVEDQHVSLAPERRLVRLEAAVEGIKLGVLPVRGGIDRGGPRVTLALDLLRLLERIG